MQKTLRVFSTFEAAETADAASDVDFSPAERLQIVIDLRDQRHPNAASEGFARVCRVVKLEQG